METTSPPDPPEWGGGISEKFSLACGGLSEMMFFQLQSAAGEKFTVSDVRNAIFLKEIDDL